MSNRRSSRDSILDYHRGIKWWETPSHLVHDALALVTGGPAVGEERRPPSPRGGRVAQRAPKRPTVVNSSQRGVRTADRQVPKGAWTKDTARRAQEAGLRAPALGPSQTQVDRFHGPGQGQMFGGNFEDPLMALYNQQRSAMESSYDEMIKAVQGLDPIYRDMAQESQGNIGGFFEQGRQQALAGVPVNQETFEGASANVDQIYNELAGTLKGMPQQQVNIATEAAGSGVKGGSVASAVSAATAPFQAAAETARANAKANLTQTSAAGENYLNQLASSMQPEAAMHQSAVESALNIQLQQIAMQAAELEGSKQRALAQLTADVSGDVSQRMAHAALASSLGLDLPPGVDPLQYLSGINTMNQMEDRSINTGYRGMELEHKLQPEATFDRVLSGANVDDRLKSTITDVFHQIDTLSNLDRNNNPETWNQLPAGLRFQLESGRDLTADQRMALALELVSANVPTPLNPNNPEMQSLIRELAASRWG